METKNLLLVTGTLKTEANLAEYGLPYEEDEGWCSCHDWQPCDCWGEESDSEDESDRASSSFSRGTQGSKPSTYDKLNLTKTTLPPTQGNLIELDPLTGTRMTVGDLSTSKTQKVLYNLGQEGGLSQYQVTVYMITAFIGVAVLVLPSLMKLGGWILPPVLSGFIAFSFLQMINVMCEAVDGANRKAVAENVLSAMGDKNFEDKTNVKQAVTTFEDVGRKSLGMCGVALVRSVTLPGLCLGVLVFSLLIASNIQTLSGKSLNQLQSFAVATPLLMLFAIIPNDKLTKAMSFGMYVSLTSCTLIMVKSLLDSRNWQDWPEVDKESLHSMWPKDVISLGTVIAVLMSSYSLMATVPTVRAQMARPQEFYAGFRDATIIVFVLYLGVMCCAYYGYGNYVQDNIVESMVFPLERPCTALRDAHCEEIGIRFSKDACYKSVIGFVMTVLTTVDLFLGFALLFKCASGMIVKLVGENECSRSGSCLNNLLRLTVVGIVVSGAMWIPSFRDVLAIRSAICCPTNNIFYPLLFKSKLSERPVSICTVCFYGLMLVFATVSLFLGLYHAISNLVVHGS